MPEPFAENELVACKTSVGDTLWRERCVCRRQEMMETRFNTGVCHETDMSGDRESRIPAVHDSTLAQKSVHLNGAEEQDLHQLMVLWTGTSYSKEVCTKLFLLLFIFSQNTEQRYKKTICDVLRYIDRSK